MRLHIDCLQMEPTFQGLPQELRILILRQIDDPKTLQSAALSCSAYYQAYLTDRPHILRKLLHWKFEGPVDIGEAIAAVRSKGLYMGKQCNKEKIIAVLGLRRRTDEIRKSIAPKPIVPSSSANIEEIIQLLQLNREANFFLEDYSRNAPARPG